MKKLIGILAFVILCFPARAQFALSVDTNGSLTVTAQGRNTNFFAANIARIRAALSNAGLTNFTIYNANLTNFTGTGTNVTLDAANIRGSSVSNTVAQDVFYIDVVNGTHAILLLDRVWALAATATGDLFIENVDTGDVPVRFNPDTRFMNPVTVSNSLTVDRGFVASNVTAQTAFYGTNGFYGGTNNWYGDFAATAHGYTSLVNRPGANTAIPIGTNVTVELSGATAVCDIHSFADRRVGYEMKVIFSGAVSNVIVNQSGSEATAALRITTGTGANVIQTNQPQWGYFRKRTGDWLLLDRSN